VFIPTFGLQFGGGSSSKKKEKELLAETRRLFAQSVHPRSGSLQGMRPTGSERVVESSEHPELLYSFTQTPFLITIAMFPHMG
jgi:hypothetical protein